MKGDIKKRDTLKKALKGTDLSYLLKAEHFSEVVQQVRKAEVEHSRADREYTDFLEAHNGLKNKYFDSSLFESVSRAYIDHAEEDLEKKGSQLRVARQLYDQSREDVLRAGMKNRIVSDQIDHLSKKISSDLEKKHLNDMPEMS